jgi:DNA-binding IclR family transcriptional regulator
MPKIVDRTLDCFETFAAERRALTQSELARLLAIAPSSSRDLIQVLQRRGYVYETDVPGGFYPTQRLYELGKQTAAHDPVLQRAETLLMSLRDVVDESVVLAQARGLQALYLLTFESQHPLRLVIRIGSNLRSLHATSAGKSLLANLDARDLAAYLAQTELAPLTAKSLRSKEALLADLEAGRTRGWFVNHEESVEGVTTLSATFKWNHAMYIVTVCGATQRMEPKLPWAAQALLDVCGRLEMRDDPLVNRISADPTRARRDSTR